MTRIEEKGKEVTKKIRRKGGRGEHEEKKQRSSRAPHGMYTCKIP
jgi:hypothetical protein